MVKIERLEVHHNDEVTAQWLAVRSFIMQDRVVSLGDNEVITTHDDSYGDPDTFANLRIIHGYGRNMKNYEW